MPRVSIIVLAYNIERYIRRCLDSLFNQTLSDIEIVVVEDHSTDNTPAILEEYASRDSRVKIVRHQENSGILWGRKTGVEASTGDYIMFVDGDDEVDLKICEKLYEAAVSREADLVVCGYLTYMRDGSVVPKSCRLSFGSDSEGFVKSLLTSEMPVSLLWRIFKKDIWKDKLYSYERHHNYADDFLLSFQLSEHIHKAVCIDDKLYHYYINPTSMSVRRLDSRAVDNNMQALSKMLDVVSRLVPEYLDMAKSNVVKLCMGLIRKGYSRSLVMEKAGSKGLSGLFSFSSLRDLFGFRKAFYYLLTFRSGLAASVIVRLLDIKDRR